MNRFYIPAVPAIIGNNQNAHVHQGKPDGSRCIHPNIPGDVTVCRQRHTQHDDDNSQKQRSDKNSVATKTVLSLNMLMTAGLVIKKMAG